MSTLTLNDKTDLREQEKNRIILLTQQGKSKMTILLWIWISPLFKGKRTKPIVFFLGHAY